MRWLVFFSSLCLLLMVGALGFVPRRTRPTAVPDGTMPVVTVHAAGPKLVMPEVVVRAADHTVAEARSSRTTIN